MSPFSARSKTVARRNIRKLTMLVTRAEILHDTLMPNASRPRRIFLSAVGLTPQVVTESLYVLATARPSFVPDEIHLLTTEEGRRRIDLMLRYGLADLAFDLDCPALAEALSPNSIHVIPGMDGKPLMDINSDVDNEAAANTICTLVRSLTADPVTRLHVSIAGGRKTMSFLLGYALSLYGRPQDTLSHVLVNDPFQTHPEFFFPRRVPKVLLGQGGRPVSTDEAKITLAEIPFVRLRHGMPADLLAGTTTYGETVARVQRAFAAPHLHLDIPRRQLVCQDVVVPLPPLLLAFYVCFILRRRQGAPVSWRELSAQEIKSVYQRLHGDDNGRWERVRHGLPAGPDDMKDYFEQKKAALHKALRTTLGSAATPYMLQPIGKRPRTRFALSLDPSAITITGEDVQ